MTGNWLVGGWVLLFSFGGSLLGSLLQKVLPPTQLGEGTREVVKLAIGIIGTLSGLVLGLTITTAKASYDQQRRSIIEVSAKIVALDRTLALYGPEAKPVREEFRALVQKATKRLWPADGAEAGSTAPAQDAERWYLRLHRMAPSTDDQKVFHGRATGMATDLLNGRWLMHAQDVSSVSIPFVVVLTLWFGIIFGSIGLVAPPTWMGRVMLFLCALSVACSVVLAFELDHPFSGLMRMSDEPMRRAIDLLGRD
jgi:hypothetical protein